MSHSPSSSKISRPAPEQPGAASEDGYAPPALVDADLFGAFHAAYTRVGVGATRLFESAAHVYAIAELLIAKGIIGIEELDERRRTVEQRLLPNYESAGLTVDLVHDAPDKYDMQDKAVKIDCEDRIALCGAACCRLRFALSKQDVEEGVVQWELMRPYMNRQRADGYCVHCDPEAKRCIVYNQRPFICRGYSCSQDKRIWQDFEKRVINPDIMQADWPQTESAVPQQMTEIVTETETE